MRRLATKCGFDVASMWLACVPLRSHLQTFVNIRAAGGAARAQAQAQAQASPPRADAPRASHTIHDAKDRNGMLFLFWPNVKRDGG
jgi:hypothetical protein